MFSHIVLALDGSAASEAALAAAGELARRDGARVTVVHVAEFVPATNPGYPVEAGEQLVRERIAAHVGQLRSAGIETRRVGDHSVVGGPAHVIARIARESGADLIVTGTRGHGALADILLGSVAQKLLHLAPCPVLVVPVPAPAPADVPQPSVEGEAATV
jgi:nucleotide-binding universal stress UspA family protein